MDGTGEFTSVYPRRTQQASYQEERRAAHPACHLEALSGASERLKPTTQALQVGKGTREIYRTVTAANTSKVTCESPVWPWKLQCTPILCSELLSFPLKSQFQEQVVSLRGEKAELLFCLFIERNPRYLMRKPWFASVLICKCLCSPSMVLLILTGRDWERRLGLWCPFKS